MDKKVYENWKKLAKCFEMTEFGRKVWQSPNNGSVILPHSIMRSLWERNKELALGKLLEAIRKSYVHNPKMYIFKDIEKESLSVTEMYEHKDFREAVENLIEYAGKMRIWLKKRDLLTSTFERVTQMN